MRRLNPGRGYGKAALGAGNIYGEPTLEVPMKTPSRYWHLANVLFEKTWLWRWC